MELYNFKMEKIEWNDIDVKQMEKLYEYTKKRIYLDKKEKFKLDNFQNFIDYFIDNDCLIENDIFSNYKDYEHISELFPFYILSYIDDENIKLYLLDGKVICSVPPELTYPKLNSPELYKNLEVGNI